MTLNLNPFSPSNNKECIEAKNRADAIFEQYYGIPPEKGTYEPVGQALPDIFKIYYRITIDNQKDVYVKCR